MGYQKSCGYILGIRHVLRDVVSGSQFRPFSHLITQRSFPASGIYSGRTLTAGEVHTQGTTEAVEDPRSLPGIIG